MFLLIFYEVTFEVININKDSNLKIFDEICEILQRELKIAHKYSL